MKPGTADWWFQTEQIEPDIYLTTEPHFDEGNRANIWLIRGSTRDVVVDTGLGVHNCREYLQRRGFIGDKPVVAIATHVHFDHSGGLADFEERGIHTLEADALRSGDIRENVSFVFDDSFTEPPYEKFSAKSYEVRKTEPTLILKDGDVISNGTRELKVLHTPGHSKGSICLWDESNKAIFSGDTVYNGEMLDFLPRSDVGSFKQSCKKLLELDVRRCYPGHFNVMNGSDYTMALNDYLEDRSGWLHPTRRIMSTGAKVYFGYRHVCNVQ